jgi:hypothetical protein
MNQRKAKTREKNRKQIEHKTRMNQRKAKKGRETESGYNTK